MCSQPQLSGGHALPADNLHVCAPGLSLHEKPRIAEVGCRHGPWHLPLLKRSKYIHKRWQLETLGETLNSINAMQMCLACLVQLTALP